MDGSVENIFGGVSEDFYSLNARLKFTDPDGNVDFDADRRAVRQYFLEHVNQNTVFFHSLEEKLNYLVDEGYYEKEVLDLYPFSFLEKIWDAAFAHKFRFPTLMGAYKYYRSYTLKTRDGKRYLERFEDRICMVALGLARGDQDFAMTLMREMISGRYQPATPTFLNTGKKSRGELVSCFLLRIEDNMESIARGINSALQLSKRGGGVALNLTNLREEGAPIKGIEGQCAGVIPVMKLLEDSFSYANQLGARPGAGAAYLSVHHPDILRFLDTKRENADEKIRIKTLSLGLVITDVFMQVAKRNGDVYLFSPHDVQKVYGCGMTEISVTEKYDEMVADDRIRKTKVRARKILEIAAAIQAESGYPYIVFEDTVNRANPVDGRVTMSNLCTEVLQVSTPSSFTEDLGYEDTGHDISCNLGSQNIAKMMDGGDLGAPTRAAIFALTAVSEMSAIDAVPSVRRGNDAMHAIGLGQMNLHGFLAREGIRYDSPEAVEFTSCYFAAITHHAISASNELAQQRGRAFLGFEKSTYADGSFFEKYVTRDWLPASDRVRDLFAKHGVQLPARADWEALKERVMQHGIYNAYLQAIAPTGSISYINHSTSAIHPAPQLIENRKEGKTGLIYIPAPFLSNENMATYGDAYSIGWKAIVDVYAAATEHIDQGAAMTLFFTRNIDDGQGGRRPITTRDINKAQIYAYTKGIKTIYYIRMSDDKLEGMDDQAVCESCSI
ncbi:class 1b ribonucleoside-diphosphate reductase subunit alpha [Leisingera caerulea]|uniref:class 1b ribonucleoside-diphosphate reductase subunit alpha n=1 Tax=Leisingera caerulea TaxID=506591 RepID=UPI0004177877|nr:class 1b ribonucleoside-diphosphate reductase subunit alpha [Leisingera caerulea]